MNGISRGVAFVGVMLAVGCGGQVVLVPDPIEDIDRDITRNDGDVKKTDDNTTKLDQGDKRQDQGDKVDQGQKTDDPPPPPPPPTAPLLANECVALATVNMSDHIARIDLGTGKITIGPKLKRGTGGFFTETMAVGVKGDDLWFCTGMSGSKVAKASLATGDVESFDVGCRYVTADESGVYVEPHSGSTILHYADEAALKSKTPTGTFPRHATSAIGMSAAGVISIAYPQYGNIRLGSGQLLALDESPGGAWGVSEASGNRFIVSNGAGLVKAYDATTGASLGDVAQFVKSGPYDYGLWGMACAR